MRISSSKVINSKCEIKTHFYWRHRTRGTAFFWYRKIFVAKPTVNATQNLFVTRCCVLVRFELHRMEKNSNECERSHKQIHRAHCEKGGERSFGRCSEMVRNRSVCCRKRGQQRGSYDCCACINRRRNRNWSAKRKCKKKKLHFLVSIERMVNASSRDCQPAWQALCCRL